MGGPPHRRLARPAGVQLLRQPAALLHLRPPLPRHSAEDAQDVVRVPAHAAQGVCRQLGERHAEGEHHRCRGEH